MRGSKLQLTLCPLIFVRKNHQMLQLENIVVFTRHVIPTY
jgi:hypothetical protein